MRRYWRPLHGSAPGPRGGGSDPVRARLDFRPDGRPGSKYEHGGEYFEGRESAATRLLVSDDLVVVWEAGAGVNDDIGDADVVAGGPLGTRRSAVAP